MEHRFLDKATTRQINALRAINALFIYFIYFIGRAAAFIRLRSNFIIRRA
jgi:hypothetical protein